ncbi:hypothetical protein MNAN1_002952 [Malassezia nana]|uniref:RRM domain-containing protein n=1 Tax=Malassezia nana TaxID=180528 RepID=A0AAF0ENK8_9BASI|nr:hypothetical protein MNAN1_002952 [Malassezia nana]
MDCHYTMFVAGWGQVYDVKLSHAVENQAQCAFVEFTSEAEAVRALHGTKFVPFMGTFLRLEPARAERTLRFSLINPTRRFVLMNPMWLQGAGPHLRSMSFQCQRVPFNELLAHDLAEPYGPIERIRTRMLPQCHVVDVIFEHRDSAFQGQAALALLPPKSNLRVRSYGWTAPPTKQNDTVQGPSMDPRFTYVHRSLPHVNYEGPVLVPTFYQKASDTVVKKDKATTLRMPNRTNSPESMAKYREAILACAQLRLNDKAKEH